MFWIILGIIIDVIFFGWTCYKLADLKGYDDLWRFTFLGVFLSVIGLIIVACLPDLVVRQKLDTTLEKISRNENLSSEDAASQNAENNSLLNRYILRDAA